jgi:hypothetical protein
MKKTLILFAAAAATSVSFTSCTKQEEKPKNYYGVEPAAGSDAPKEGYYAMFGGVILFIIFIVWVLKRSAKK